MRKFRVGVWERQSKRGIRAKEVVSAAALFY
jgi:hypothetical protein